jgi:hypothetical protein
LWLRERRIKIISTQSQEKKKLNSMMVEKEEKKDEKKSFDNVGELGFTVRAKYISKGEGEEWKRCC